MEYKYLIITEILILAIIQRQGASYPSGAPLKSCEYNIPQHGLETPAQMTKCPYSISISKQWISYTENITVTLKGINGAKFVGFLVQAKNIDGVVGRFESGELHQQIKCPSKDTLENTATHINSKPKDFINLTWIPAYKEAQIFDAIMVAVFVKDFMTFWAEEAAGPIYVSYYVPSVAESSSSTSGEPGKFIKLSTSYVDSSTIFKHRGPFNMGPPYHSFEKASNMDYNSDFFPSYL